MCILEEGEDDSDSAVAQIKEGCALHSGKAESPLPLACPTNTGARKQKVASVWVSFAHSRVDVVDSLRCALRYFGDILLGISVG